MDLLLILILLVDETWCMIKGGCSLGLANNLNDSGPNSCPPGGP